MSKKEDLNLIVLALKEGNQKVFEQIYTGYYEELCVYLLGYCQDREIVEDVVQDMFVKFWIKRSRLNIKTSIKGYLYKSSYYMLMNQYRSLKKKNKMLSSYYDTALMRAIEVDSSEQNEHLNKLEICIQKLPKRCREVFYESKISGLKHVLVAEKLNISIKTVEGHITRALGLIRDCLF